MRLLAILFFSTALTAAPREWRDSIRDVYIDGKLDRNAQTLVTSSPRMFAIVCGEEVVIFNPESKAVSRAPRSELAFAPDRTKAAEEGGRPVRPTAGEVIQPNESTYLLTLGGRTLLVSAHQSKAGAMSLDELWQTAPVWRAIAEQYEPDAAVVERLRAIAEPTQLQVVLATWCGDSRQHVPRLLKAIERAANPNLTVELIGIGTEFLSPMELVQGENITNVPTVIVRRGANEVGRFVETPAGTTIEGDIADIAYGTPQTHPGRHERGALVTRGTYRLRDARRRFEGTETFEIYEGRIVHSMIRKRDGTSIETWAGPTFVEITTRGATTTRTRFRRDGELWHAHSRGADGGIVDQTLVAPAAVVTPATMTWAWARGESRAYVASERGGVIREVNARVDGGEVPRRVRLSDGSVRVLE
ncbi:MAG TPA: thioredoxin family protein [Thermoanaerobaculia bacterium]|nr:thioredoxin family protein [Thermoanaerobaculia bacterium]